MLLNATEGVPYRTNDGEGRDFDWTMFAGILEWAEILRFIQTGLLKPEAQAKGFEDIASLARQASMRDVLGKIAVTLFVYWRCDCDIKFHE